MNRTIGAAMFAAGLLGACATPYQPMAVTGGVQASRITADTAQITARGNAYTDPDAIQRFALRRAAEETINDGYDLFRIEGVSDRSQGGSESFGYANGNRRSAFATAFSMPILKPGQTLMIKMVRGPRPEPMPDDEFDAREVLKYALEETPSHDHRDCALVDGKEVCR